MTRLIVSREISESEWWRERVAGPGPYKQPTINEFPAAGYFKRRLVKGGPFVPARIWLVEHICPHTGDYMADTDYRCEVNGQPRDAFDQWAWLCSHPISRADYRYMVADAAYARDHAPNDPKATPAAAVDFLTATIPF